MVAGTRGPHVVALIDDKALAGPLRGLQAQLGMVSLRRPPPANIVGAALSSSAQVSCTKREAP